MAHDVAIEMDAALKQELLKLQQQVEEAGHKPDLTLVDPITKTGKELTDDEKRWSLCTHSERIAIAYGMLHVPQGQPLYLTKNLRVCTDCHEETKIISKIRQREIIVSDANRIHHFKNGKCTCEDYW